jgi:hypothetical protein
MLKDIVTKGAVDRSVTVTIVDSTDGTPETGVVFNTSGIDLWYRREGGSRVAITEATLASLATAHADGGFLHISDGIYRLDLPDAAFATGANHVDFGGTVTGMVVIGGRVRLVDVNLEDAVRGGMTALPNAAAAANGGLPTVDATNSVKIQTVFKRGQALAKYKFVMTDSTNHNPATGLTVAVSRQIDSATTFTSVGTATETANGGYHIDLASGDMNGTVILLKCTASGADDLFITLTTEP